jgi:hypothetical protein
VSLSPAILGFSFRVLHEKASLALKFLSRLKFELNSFVIPYSHNFHFALDSLFCTHIIFILRNASSLGWVAVVVVDAVAMYVVAVVAWALNSFVVPYSHNVYFCLIHCSLPT